MSRESIKESDFWILENEETQEKRYMHSIHPRWLEHSITKSLNRLNVETLDCVYLMDPIECAMTMYHKDYEHVKKQLGKAFRFLEEMV